MKDIDLTKPLYIYAGDLVKWNKTKLKHRYKITKKNWIGLTLPIYGNKNQSGSCDNNHIYCDITTKMNLPDNVIDIYQSEDVHEHLEYNILVEQINDIYRCLKPNGLFRLSIPDYNCDFVYNRTIKDKNGKLIFDPRGGGYYDDKEKKVKGNGHVWFPTYMKVKSLLEKTKFKNINFLEYYDENKNPVIKKINYSLGYIRRTSDNDKRVRTPTRRPLSIIVDCYK